MVDHTESYYVAYFSQSTNTPNSLSNKSVLIEQDFRELYEYSTVFIHLIIAKASDY